MQHIIKITQLFPEILAHCYLEERWACPSMPGHTQKILHDLTIASLLSYYIQKMSIIPQIVCDIKLEKILKYDWWRAYQTFFLRTRLFFRYAVFTKLYSQLRGTLKATKNKKKQKTKNAALAKYSAFDPLVQIHLVNPITYTTNTIFQNPALYLFSIYGKMSSCKKLRKSTHARAIPFACALRTRL